MKVFIIKNIVNKFGIVVWGCALATTPLYARRIMGKLEILISRNKNTLKFLLTIFSGIATFIFIYIAFDTFVIDRIDQRIKDPAYIRELSTSLRPFLIFDKNGIVTYDHGATKYVNDIKVKIGKHKTYNIQVVKEITIKCNKYLNTAPLLDYIDVDQYTYDVKRIKQYSWKYEFKPMLAILAESNEKKSDNIYILEILL